MDETMSLGYPTMQKTFATSPYAGLHDLLRGRAEHSPEALAILASGRPPLTYGELYRRIDEVGQTLHTAGLGRHDRIALVMPNGPEMAVALLAIATGMTCLPLNPAYGPYEFATYLADLNADAMIIHQDMDSPARDAARAQGIPALDLSPCPEAAAGVFTLSGAASAGPAPRGVAAPDDVACVLHTSGTTSRPKMVSMTHANVCQSAYNTCVAVEFTAGDRCLNVLPLVHSYGLITTLVMSLMAGASIVCTPGFEVDAFFTWMEAFRPTWYPAVPTIHQAILAAAAQHREIVMSCPLRLISSAGAALPAPVLAELEHVFQAPVIECYGMTEATSWISTNPLPPRQRKVGSVGLAAGPEVAIMDAAGAMLPAGQTGEVVIRGTHVMRGYDNSPDANEGVFTDGWFRTGDEGFLDADGYLFITGRLKEMINRGGEKVTPLEVDGVLLAHPAVAQALTFAVPHPRLGEDVAAVVVLHGHASASDRDIRQFAAQQLAPFKVPQQVRIVDEIPKSPIGKLRRIGMAEKLGLTTSEPARQSRPDGDEAPRTPVEAWLADLWAELLGHERVDVHDNFFQLGGDSILAAQLIARIRDTWRTEIAFQDFFEAPTVAGMATCIDDGVRPLAQMPPLQPLPKGCALPLSHAQQRLWFIEQLGLSQHAYHLLDATRLLGPLNVAILNRSLTEITRRHDILRTTFTEVEDEVIQVVGAAVAVPLPVVDLQALPAHRREICIRELAREEVQQGFDLTRGPLFRARLLRLEAEAHVLILAIHNIIFDDWSHGVFWRELATLYQAFLRGAASSLPELSIQYADAAHWHQRQLAGDVEAQQLDYWRHQLAGAVPQEILTDHPRPAVQTFRGARHPLIFSPQLTQGLKTVSQQQQVTLFMTLLAAVQVLLHRYTGQSDILVGSLIANRNQVEIEKLIGFWVNTLVLRTDLSGNPRFQDLLRRVRETTLGAYRHCDLPFEKLLEALRPARDLSRNPLFQVLFVFHNLPKPMPEIPGLTLCPLEVDGGTSRFDITLDLWETAEGLQGWLEYNTDLFEAATIARLGRHLQTLLEGVIRAPDQPLSRLPLLTASERRQLLTEWCAAEVEQPHEGCLHRLFEIQVAQTPDAIAVIEAERHLTYRELNRRANQVAHHLRAQGVSAGEFVGLYMGRSIDMVVGLLGILKADAAYVPLDPDYPRERLAFMWSDSQLSLVVTQAHLWADAPAPQRRAVCLDVDWPDIARQPEQNPMSQATMDSPATVLYTSGSTGKPKGVLSAHGAIVNVLSWLWRTFPLRSQDVACLKIVMSFSDAVQELLTPLLRGTPIVIMPGEPLRDLDQFVRRLARHRVTRALFVPSLLRVLLDTYADLRHRLPDLTLWFVSGEALSSELVQRFREVMPGHRLINLYGATENAADVTWYEAASARDEQTRVPIGRPIDNMRMYVLDADQQLTPMGHAGELHVGGIGLAQSYLSRPAVTAQQFAPDPFSLAPGARLYKTGDLVRYRPDGHIEYLGRLDQQVKVRGHRVEPEEIESALEQHPTVERAVVMVKEESPADQHLVAYLVPSPEQVPKVSVLRRFLQPILPDYMRPSVFVTLDALPLTPTGKVDRLALPAPARVRPELEASFLAPRNATEEVVAGIWADLFGLDQVGVHDHFFDLGGHSLLAIQVMSRLRAATRVEVPLQTLFDAPTVAALSRYVEAAQVAGRDRDVEPIAPMPREHDAPVSMLQEQFWNIEQVISGTGLFNIPLTIRLTGDLDVAALELSLNHLIQRHEIIRTAIVTADGQPVQRVAPCLELTIAVTDLRQWPEPERSAYAHQLARAQVLSPIDLTQAPLLRVGLLWLGDREHLLMVTLHHIIMDGWSLGIFANELAILYDGFSTGGASPLPALPVQYGDFAHWQRQWCHSRARNEQLAYWREQLREPLPVLTLPTDRPRGEALSFHSARASRRLPAELSKALMHLSRQLNCILLMTLLTAFNILLHRYTGLRDLCVSTLLANRTRQEIESTIGLFTNTTLLRTDLRGNPTCREVLQRVRTAMLAAYTHQDLPFQELAQALAHERGLEPRALSQVMFILQPSMPPPLRLSNLTLEVLEINLDLMDVGLTATTFDLILLVRDMRLELEVSCIYKSTLFDDVTIHRLLGHFQSVLDHMIAQPEQPLSTLHSALT